MPTVAFLLHRRSLGEGILQELKRATGYNGIITGNYSEGIAVCQSRSADVALVEVSESDEKTTAYCLNVCRQIRQKVPNCKILLLTPDKDQAKAEAAIQAKKSGQIDDFILYDASLQYIICSIQALA